MKFKDFDTYMRSFETNNDNDYHNDYRRIIRLDGRGFTKLCAKKGFEKPFDYRFSELMIETTKHLMSESGFNFDYCYTQSDEISLLLSKTDRTFSGKERKLLSVLAGEASAKFSLLLGDIGVFDSRVSTLPMDDEKLIDDYFKWRQTDARRNCLNSYCYWSLIKNNYGKRKATKLLYKKTIEDKIDLLMGLGINYEYGVEEWHKNGIGFQWVDYEKEGIDKITGKSIVCTRRKIEIEHNPVTIHYLK